MRISHVGWPCHNRKTAKPAQYWLCEEDTEGGGVYVRLKWGAFAFLKLNSISTDDVIFLGTAVAAASQTAKSARYWLCKEDTEGEGGQG